MYLIRNAVSVVKTSYISAHRFSCKVSIFFFFRFELDFNLIDIFYLKNLRFKL